jgi:hypothetical protein
VDGVFLPKTLINGGNSLNIIFIETLRKMDFDFSKMTACDEPIYSVVPSNAAYPIGRVCLLVTFGTKENIRTEYLTFEVADFRSYYHAILGRPMLAKFMAIPHHTYLIMKITARAIPSTSPKSLPAKLPLRSWLLGLSRSTKPLWRCQNRSLQPPPWTQGPR